MAHCIIRWTEMDETKALRDNKEDFDKPMRLSTKAIEELKWWINCVEKSYGPVSHGPTQVTMTIDASKTGWRCTVNGIPTGGAERLRKLTGILTTWRPKLCSWV